MAQDIPAMLPPTTNTLPTAAMLPLPNATRMPRRTLMGRATHAQSFVGIRAISTRDFPVFRAIAVDDGDNRQTRLYKRRATLVGFHLLAFSNRGV
jgi:hypothetical protein